jgi:hypothetical protein
MADDAPPRMMKDAPPKFRYFRMFLAKIQRLCPLFAFSLPRFAGR